jgi:carbonic anhydrase/acetyltransferase-like protein (isoleucine patch superfamily)
MIRSLKDKTPVVHPSAWVNEAAYVVGDVEIGEDSTVWPCAVLRGDGKIKIGRDTHVQDGTVIHSGTVADLGSHINIGHSVVIHDVKIGDHCLIGNNATVLSQVEIGDHCLIAANAMVRQGTEVPSHSFVVGVPAVVRPLNDEQRARLEQGVTRGFIELAREYRDAGL